jgi:hypothetical protein
LANCRGKSSQSARCTIGTRARNIGYSTIEVPSLRTALALNGEKKEAGFPAPLEMTGKVDFVFFLATAITAYRRRSLHAALSSRSTTTALAGVPSHAT